MYLLLFDLAGHWVVDVISQINNEDQKSMKVHCKRVLFLFLRYIMLHSKALERNSMENCCAEGG